VLEFLFLIAGMAGLWFGSEVLVRGAESLTRRFRLSDAAFGMLVLAVGTDLPELFVAVDASVRSLHGEDLSGIVIGSAVGSSVGQFALVFGAAGMIGFEALRRRYLARNTLFLVGSVVALFGFSLGGVISRFEGFLLGAAYAIYLYVVISRRAQSPDANHTAAGDASIKDWLYLASGLVLLLLSAELTVASAIDFARIVGLSNVAVSAVIIGMGSSLPELSVSFAALLKGRGQLSAGNLIGSNILDTLLVPGLAAMISPLAVPPAVLLIDLPALMLVSVLVILFMYVSRRGIRKLEALILLAIYAAYVMIRLTGPGS
jgi:cation:H+ antiporter